MPNSSKPHTFNQNSTAAIYFTPLTTKQHHSATAAQLLRPGSFLGGGQVYTESGVHRIFGPNRKDLLAIKFFLDQIKMFCFRSDSKWTKSKRFAFVPIISFDIKRLCFRFDIVDITTANAGPILLLTSLLLLACLPAAAACP